LQPPDFVRGEIEEAIDPGVQLGLGGDRCARKSAFSFCFSCKHGSRSPASLGFFMGFAGSLKLSIKASPSWFSESSHQASAFWLAGRGGRQRKLGIDAAEMRP
jgi:hypothetical protein